MTHYLDTIDGIRDIFIEMSNSIVSDEGMILIINKYKTLLKDIDEAYRCIRSLNINNDVIYMTRNHIKNNAFVEIIEVISCTPL